MNKKYFILILVISIILLCCHNKKVGPFLQTNEDTLNMGVIKSNKILEVSFTLYNTGGDTLRIKNIGTSCGCTIVTVQREVLPPDDSTIVKVNYSPNDDKDSISKSIIIESNSPEPFKLVHLMGFVIN